MKNPRLKYLLLLAPFILVLMNACKHDRNHPGYAYMPDMYYSEAAEPYTPSTVFSDSLTMQTPVKGTIPRGYLPYPFKAKSADDQKLAGEMLINPIEPDENTLKTGKEQYDIYCAICHGPNGKGDGPLYKSGKFTARPTSLVENYVQSKKDGEIYHVITLGSLSGLMGAHGAQISAENRWKIIHYVRTLGRK